MSTGNKELDRNVKTFKKYRNLLKELTAKNVKLKYRNSWLGILWSFIQPLLQMIVLSVSSESQTSMWFASLFIFLQVDFYSASLLRQQSRL